ncbi:MAG TPA: hypothetical protein VG518_03005, partial [Solirubrobacterales bacterium]|nr:hypothetical protein [Solirubrobacterales bacterium]
MTASESVDRVALDACERGFWGEIWDSVPAQIAAARGIELRRFGPIQASICRALPDAHMLNLVLGAAEAGAVEEGHLEAAVGWAESQGVDFYVPLTPSLAGSSAAEQWLARSGYEPGYAWMKFVRDPHPPRFAEPAGVEVVELEGEEEPFG